MVKATRIIGEKESQECRYYLSSLEPNAELTRISHKPD
jgi:hypothetical protein